MATTTTVEVVAAVVVVAVSGVLSHSSRIIFYFKNSITVNVIMQPNMSKIFVIFLCNYFEDHAVLAFSVRRRNLFHELQSHVMMS